MECFKFFCVLLALSVSTIAGDSEPSDDEYDYLNDGLKVRAFLEKLREERAWKDSLSDLTDRRIRAFECKQIGEDCRGVVPCCGTTQCFWQDGYSAIKAGKCVTCVSSNQQCQRDSQCCNPLVCQKGNTYHVNGRCDAKRSSGSECHEGDQCASGRCNISTWSKFKGQGGSCA